MTMSKESVLTALQSDVLGQTPGGFLSAHLHKPEKAPLYQSALIKFLINGHFRFAATWSWWAFFGGAFFFFYRKMYLYGLIALGVDVVAAFFVPLGTLIVAVCCGAGAKYFYCKKFIEDLDVAGYPGKPAEEIRHTLTLLGGYNTWAIIVFILLSLMKIAVLIFSGAVLMTIFSGIQ
jgi:hypothetical protein